MRGRTRPCARICWRRVSRTSAVAVLLAAARVTAGCLQMTVEETLWFLIVGAVLVLSIASGERASSVLYFQKHVVDVELDRAVAF